MERVAAILDPNVPAAGPGEMGCDVPNPSHEPSLPSGLDGESVFCITYAVDVKSSEWKMKPSNNNFVSKDKGDTNRRVDTLTDLWEPRDKHTETADWPNHTATIPGDDKTVLDPVAKTH